VGKIDFDIQASRATHPFFYKAPEPGGKFHLAPYQHAGVEYGIRRRHRIIGDPPGVGKSAQCVALSNAMDLDPDEPTLIVCPASLRLNWEREVWMWSTIENVKTYPILKAADGVSNEADYVIMSYDMLRNPDILEAIMDMRWGHLILDEAHYLKDPKGNKRTRPICAPDMLPSVVGSITMASGTLMPNQPIECYNAVRLLNWDAIDRMSLESFRDYYYEEGGGMVRGKVWVGDPENGHWESKLHYSNKVRNVPRRMRELQYRLRKNLMVRRSIESVLPDLPKARWHPFPLVTTAEMRKALNHPGWVQAERLYDMNPTAFDHGVPIDGEIATARRLLGEAKAPAVCDYIEDLLNEGIDKIVVSAWHKSVLDILRERLSKYGLLEIRGSVGKRQHAVDLFQTDDHYRIIMGQQQVLMLGWTLTKSRNVIMAEFDYVPGNNDQVIGKLRRRGQMHGVIGHIPVVPGTMDERILGTAIEKDQDLYEAQDAA
jgi:SWI/SNF-related matrix-associated actin-dependent regulator 1 of chromatin subfamily A